MSAMLSLSIKYVKVSIMTARQPTVLPNVKGGFVAATCAYTRAIDRSSRAGYRSILVLTSLANTRAGQSERRLPPAPIRTPEW